MKKVIIYNIKNIQSMTFIIPDPGLHIIAGKNGSGKTTLFTCLSRICNNNAFRVGFPSKSNDTYDLFTGSIEYHVDNNSVTYTRRQNGEWRPNTKNSTVLSEFRYPSVINITTKDKRVFSQENIYPRQRRNTDEWLNQKLNRIFDTDRFSNMIKIITGDLRRGRATERDRRNNIAYAIPLGDGRYYTERNFSFGEIVLINLLFDIKSATNGSLVLIDELEMAIHPSAQIRLIDCLNDIAREKGLTIIISTHSASIIRAQKDVIFLETYSNGRINCIYHCPPAKAIGAIGMREDTNPDIISLVEDTMAKSFFHALVQKYISLQNEDNYLDIRIMQIGGFCNVMSFYKEANDYLFYDNVYVTAFLDKDVQTDVISYPQYGNEEAIEIYNNNSAYIHFLPYTPEVLLVKVYHEHKAEILGILKNQYNNQQLDYTIDTTFFDYDTYIQPLPTFTSQNEYNRTITSRGVFRNKCKKEVERVAGSLANQINRSAEEVYRTTFKYAVDTLLTDEGFDVRRLLSSTMKRITH